MRKESHIDTIESLTPFETDPSAPFSDPFGAAFGFAQGTPTEVGGVKDVRKQERDISIKMSKQKGIGIGGDEEGEDDDQFQTATDRYVSSLLKTPSFSSEVQGTDLALNVGDDLQTDATPDILTSSYRPRRDIGVMDASSGVARAATSEGAESLTSVDYFPDMPIPEDKTDVYVASVAAGAGSKTGGTNYVAEGINYGLQKVGMSTSPVTSVGGYNLPGYSTSSYTTAAAPTLGGQIAGGIGALGSAYVAYDAFKGGIDGWEEGVQATTGVIGTIAGLQTAGLLSGNIMGAIGGPWTMIALGAVSYLANSGMFSGKEKVPMGGVEVRLGDDQGNLYTTYQEGKNQKIVAGQASSYNGFNSSAMKSQLQKNIDYLYAFADEFDLEVNEKAWAEAAFGPNKYMPKGREQPYRSALEKIDSMGDGSSSPGEWLRHALEYESPEGERIINGQIYKGARIGPDGMPVKVGYKSQEAFQQAVADFNKKFFG